MKKNDELDYFYKNNVFEKFAHFLFSYTKKKITNNPEIDNNNIPLKLQEEMTELIDSTQFWDAMSIKEISKFAVRYLKNENISPFISKFLITKVIRLIKASSSASFDNPKTGDEEYEKLFENSKHLIDDYFIIYRKTGLPYFNLFFEEFPHIILNSYPTQGNNTFAMTALYEINDKFTTEETIKKMINMIPISSKTTGGGRVHHVTALNYNLSSDVFKYACDKALKKNLLFEESDGLTGIITSLFRYPTPSFPDEAIPVIKERFNILIESYDYKLTDNDTEFIKRRSPSNELTSHMIKKGLLNL